MAEKSKEEKKDANPGITATKAYIADAIFGLFGHRVGDKMLNFVWDMVDRKVIRAEERPTHIISFGEALAKLKEVDEHSYDVIRDFMLVSLIEPADLDDFQVRTAKMGGDNVDVTVAFLQLVAAEPDHDSRKAFLDRMGIIGERAIDTIERAQLLAQKAGSYLKANGGQMLAWIRKDMDGAFEQLHFSIEADTDRLREELKQRRRAKETPPPEVLPRTIRTNNGFKDRLRNAYRALRGQ